MASDYASRLFPDILLQIQDTLYQWRLENWKLGEYLGSKN
jgi:hypothetical protein